MSDVQAAMRSTSPLAVLTAVVVSFLPMAPAEAAPVNSFVDDDNSRFEPFIERAKEQGLIAGCNPPTNNRICPHHAMTRGHMAMVLARALATPAPAEDHFSDDNGHPAEGAINALMDAGVNISCGGDRFCPDRAISRGEMAALISRVFAWQTDAPPERYLDLEDSLFSAPLAELAQRGGLAACDPPINQRLCPTATVRTDEAIYAVVAALDLGPASPRTKDPELQRLGFGDGFYDLTLWDGRGPSTRNQVSITTNGYRESGLHVRIPKGSHYGADFHLHLDDAADVVPERLFFRYFLKLDENWSTPISGKLPGFSGVYGSTGKGGYQSRPSDPGWSARLMFSPTTPDGLVPIGYYVYHLGQETRYGDGVAWNEAGKLRPGDWYCLEGEIEMNTLGLADGALRAWVDETPALDVSGLEFRRPSEPEIKIESFWFNVYYGGKPVAPHELGLTVDDVMVDTERVGCGAGEGVAKSATADFDGNGYRDHMSWTTCPGGRCFRTENNTWTGRRVENLSADGAWFSLASHRLGWGTGDVDGDRREDLVYHGRCDGATPCWRVHRTGVDLTNGENWGGGARFSRATAALTLGDFGGDGLADLVYQGLCGDTASPCWRVHTSTGSAFGSPVGWGPHPEQISDVTATDLTGDGRDDLVYKGRCDESQCWFTQTAQDGGFDSPLALGPALEADPSQVAWLDFDGNGASDLVNWVNSSDLSWVEVRYVQDGELTESVRLAEFSSSIEDVAVRRRARHTPIQAVVTLACEESTPCVETFLATSPERLVASEIFRDTLWSRPGSPRID